MSGVWDTAEMLIAITGDGDADTAAAAARAMAADSGKLGRVREAAFWSDVAVAVSILANPQPLIAPRLPPAGTGQPGRAARPVPGHRDRAGPSRSRASWPRRCPRGCAP